MIASTPDSQHVAVGQEPTPDAALDDAQLVAALRRGDEAAFVALVERYHMSLIRVAQQYVSSRALAEEVAQETWLGVLQGLQRFEGRSSLRTWIFHILTNRAKTRGQREGRSVPFSSLDRIAEEGSEPAVDPQRFRSGEQLAGHWLVPPQSWDHLPEERVLSEETRACIDAAVAKLPPHQRLVLTLRDIEGMSSHEVCQVLEVSEANQRVLLHRARSRVRSALEEYFREA